MDNFGPQVLTQGKRRAAAMVKEPTMARRFAILSSGFVLLVIVFTSLFTCAAALFAQYPSRSQVSKDGSTVLLEVYASLPVSSPTHGRSTAGAIAHNAQLGRVNLLPSEPTSA